MISFNNKKIEELSNNELSKQLFNISRHYSDIHLNTNYITMFLCVAEYLENGFSNYNFSVKTFIQYNKEKQISMYEKNILIVSYIKYLNQLSKVNSEKKDFYQSIIYLLNSMHISHKYIHFFNLCNDSYIKERETFKQKDKFLNLLKKEIVKIYNFKNKRDKKEEIDILNLALKELNYCLNLEDLIYI